mmetsp:Transcript_68146/g.160404  ORF Transcript_68146/g.160404 Transcript_68146/m.160404 type:complete len:370 (+) Transcript_68146:38-1147(+)
MEGGMFIRTLWSCLLLWPCLSNSSGASEDVSCEPYALVEDLVEVGLAESQMSLLQSMLEVQMPRGNVTSAQTYANSSDLFGSLPAQAKLLLEISPSVEASKKPGNLVHETLVPLLSILLFPLAALFLMLLTPLLPPGFLKGDASPARTPTPSRRPSIPEFRVASAPAASPICGKMLLPNSEVFLNMSLPALRTSKHFPISGAANRTLLVVSFGVSKSRRPMLRVAYESCESDPRCSIELVNSSPLLFQVYGRKDCDYGIMEPATGSLEKCCVVKHKGMPILHLEVSSAEGLEAVILNPKDGRRLAVGGSVTAEQWQLQVAAGADALLIVSCILGVVRLWPSSSTAEQPAGSLLLRGSPPPRGSPLQASP